MSPQTWIWFAGVVLWGATTLSLMRLRRWLLFYLVGAFGFVLLIASGASIFDIDTLIESIEATQVRSIAALFGIAVTVVEKTGLAIPNRDGWAVFDIGIECSAILEMATVVGLTAFYPAFRPGKRALFGVIGALATYAINIGRILIIVGVIGTFGTDWVFTAHAVFGRVFFFMGTVAVYWFLLTRPTIGFARRRLEEGASA